MHHTLPIFITTFSKCLSLSNYLALAMPLCSTIITSVQIVCPKCQTIMSIYILLLFCQFCVFICLHMETTHDHRFDNCLNCLENAVKFSIFFSFYKIAYCTSTFNQNKYHIIHTYTHTHSHFALYTCRHSQHSTVGSLTTINPQTNKNY